MWKLLPVYCLVSILDLRCMAFDDTSTTKIRTKTNGKLDPSTFEVFPASTGDGFDKFSKDEKMFENDENDPDMEIFFRDMDFFKDDDKFYKTSFDDDLEMSDFFSSLEESRNRYEEDVNNIDKMFKTPVKSNIDELLRGETTRVDTTSKNLNNSEPTNDRNGYHTTKRSVDVLKTNSSKEIPMTNFDKPENSLNGNLNLFTDFHGTDLVAKLVPVKERHVKSVVDDVEEKDKNKKARGSDVHGGLVGSQGLKPGNSILDSMPVVTEISVQETVNGKTVQRKPSSEELRLIESRMLGFPVQNISEKGIEKISYVNTDYDELDQNNTLSQNEDTAQRNNLPNDVIDDLSSFLKVDPNFADDGEDKILIDDDEVKDMDVILSDKDNEYDDTKRNNARRNEEMDKNVPSNIKTDNGRQEGQDIDVNNVDDNEKDPKNNNAPSNGNSGTEDPRNYRKIFHTEHKNSSNVSDVKITFSETEGDFLDDDDDDNEYTSNTTKKPDLVQERKNVNSSSEDNKQENETNKYTDQLENNSQESLVTELSRLEYNTDLPVIKNEDQNTEEDTENIDSVTVTTVTNQVDILVTDIPQVTEFTTNKNYYDETTSGSDGETENLTDVPQHTTDYMFVTENVPNYTENEEVILSNNAGSSKSNKNTDTFSNSDSFTEENISVSNQNVNDTINIEEPVTNLYEDLEEPISEDPFISKDDKEMDEIDRTMALIKKILNESKTLEEVEAQEQEDLRKYIGNNKEKEETVTIPMDISTVPIDSTTSMSEFTETTNNFNTIDIITETDSSLIFIGSTGEPALNTESSSNGAVAMNTVIPTDSTIKPNVITTIKTNKPVTNNNAPKIVGFKETEVEPHEPSPSEVASMYNSKIEEYESLEDKNYVSEEENDGWIIFGTNKNKERESTVNKENGQSEKIGAEVLTKPTTDTVLSNSDKQEPGNAQDIIENEQEKQLIPMLNGNILNNSAEFSLKITKEDEVFYVPSSAHIREYPNTINITWETNEYLNNSIALKVFEKENFYVIKEIMINLLTGNEFKKQKKLVAFAPALDDSISDESRGVRMRDGTYIFFSNVDFLKKSYEQLEYSEAAMRQRRLWHIEIASICLAAIAIIGIVFYVVAIKTKKKITLREKNELAQVTHC